jgi:gamma-glutamyl-gamma-aminobutyraldehyde dehydrogenase
MELHDLSYWEALASNIRFQNKAFIDGCFVDAISGNTFEAISPIDGRKLTDIAACDEADVNVAVAAAKRAFDGGVWSRLHPRERKHAMLTLARLIDEHREELALLETLDMGKPIADAMAYDLPETAKCYAWYAEAIDKQYDEIAPTGDNALATITREPVGVVGAVVPWNYPLMMASWKIAPALAVGNSVVLKPAEQSTLSALRMAELVKQAGIPDGVFNVVSGMGATAGKALGLHMDVDCIAFTGSTLTGKRFMEYASQSNLKRVWLECGGKSPHIIFEDCEDIEKAAKAAAAAIFTNQGEVCIAGSRLYVQASIYDTFMDSLTRHAQKMTPGNPLDPRSAMGAIVDKRQMQTVLSYIDTGLKEGGSLRTGGKQAQTVDGGNYIEPTIVECQRQDARLVQEEIFGPVLAVQQFSSEEEVIGMANDSPYGLGAGLWTANISRAHRVSRRLRAGLVWVNCYADGDITVPFGGVKQSGFGRDKSLHALDKYSDLKTTWFSLDV